MFWEWLHWSLGQKGEEWMNEWVQEQGMRQGNCHNPWSEMRVRNTPWSKMSQKMRHLTLGTELTNSTGLQQKEWQRHDRHPCHWGEGVKGPEKDFREKRRYEGQSHELAPRVTHKEVFGTELIWNSSSLARGKIMSRSCLRKWRWHRSKMYWFITAYNTF